MGKCLFLMALSLIIGPNFEKDYNSEIFQIYYTVASRRRGTKTCYVWIDPMDDAAHGGVWQV